MPVSPQHPPGIVIPNDHTAVSKETRSDSHLMRARAAADAVMDLKVAGRVQRALAHIGGNLQGAKYFGDQSHRSWEGAGVR
ncbi:hypothetical protein MHYP_G00132120 [Metynnis hypsauchen]